MSRRWALTLNPPWLALCSYFQVKELLKPFGDLKSFNMLKDKEGHSKGVAIFEFAERNQADVALKGLAGLEIGDKRLHIQEIPAEQANMLLKPTTTTDSDDDGASQVIRLGNMLAPDMVSNDWRGEEGALES